MTNLTQDRLKELLSYDPDSGDFTRLINRRSFKKGSVAGGLVSQGYIQIKIDGRKYLAHRLAFLYMTGSFPPNHTDHINGITDDNHWLNLRSATCGENMKNQKKRRDNKSGFVGVNWDDHTKKWRSQIQVDGKRIQLGLFISKRAAITARKVAEVKNNYHPNHGRSA